MLPYWYNRKAMVVYLFLIIFLSLVMVKAGEVVTVNFSSLAKKTRLPQFAVTGLIMGLATSLPELFIGLSSVIVGQPIVSLGNLVGANIANISLVIGAAALIGGRIIVRGKLLRRDIHYAFLAATLPMVLLTDKVLSRTDGLILLGAYFFYQWQVFKRQKAESDAPLKRIIHQLEDRKSEKELFWILSGILVLLAAGEILVKLAEMAARQLNLPVFLVSLMLISLGTTMPELIFEVGAARKRKPSMVFGNLMGSLVVNGSLVAGLVAVFSPIRIQAFSQYLLATMAFVVIFWLFYFFVRTKSRLDRWEGGVLLAFYLIFVLTELFRR